MQEKETRRHRGRDNGSRQPEAVTRGHKQERGLLDDLRKVGGEASGRTLRKSSRESRGAPAPKPRKPPLRTLGRKVQIWPGPGLREKRREN